MSNSATATPAGTASWPRSTTSATPPSQAPTARATGPPPKSAAAIASQLVADAAHAAEDSTDFSAAESSCVGSIGRCLDAAASSKGMNPLQARILIASDLDLIRFACQEARIGRYDGVGDQVLSRL